MYPRIDPDPELLRLAALQAGVLTAQQVAAHGLGRHSIERLITHERWTRMATGLYLTSAAEASWSAKAWGGVLLGGQDARLGGLAAGHLLGFNDPPETVHVLVPWRRRVRSRSPWRFERERPSVRSASSYGSPPRLSVEDTVLDLAEQASSSRMIDLLTTAVQQRLTTVERLRQTAQRRSRLRQRQVLLELLADVADGAETPLEIRYLRDVERAHGLPLGQRQRESRRGKEYRDVLYEEFSLVVELDGRLGHDGVDRFRDMDRDNAALLDGEVTLRYGWHDVHSRACPTARQVGALMIQRGWSGRPRRCCRCLDD